MSSIRTFTSQLASGRIGGSASARPGGNALRPPSIPDRRVKPNVSRTPSGRPVSIGSVTQLPPAEDRVAMPRFRLLCDGITQASIVIAVGGIDVVVVEAIRALDDVGIQVDHGLAIPAHEFPPARLNSHRC